MVDWDFDVIIRSGGETFVMIGAGQYTLLTARAGAGWFPGYSEGIEKATKREKRASGSETFQ